MTNRQLTVHNASVTTMTVEVKTLTIGARQVTQGIFKQLIKEDLVAEDGTLNGVPWGHVTWHPDGCSGSDHWHVVWQAGEELRRATVDKECRFMPLQGAVVDNFAAVWLAAEARGETCGQGAIRLGSGVPDGGLRSVYITTEVSRAHNVTLHAYPGPAAAAVADARHRMGSAEKSLTKPLEANEVPHAWGAHASLYGLLKRSLDNCEVAPNPSLTGISVTTSDDDLRSEIKAGEARILQMLRSQRGYHLAAFESARDALPKSLANLDTDNTARGLSWDEAQKACEDMVREEAQRRLRHVAVRAQLAELPQLFIGG